MIKLMFLIGTIAVSVAASVWVALPSSTSKESPKEVRLKAVVDMIPSDAITVLDAGSGSGVISKKLIERGFRVTSVDKYPRKDAVVPTVEGDIYKLPFADGSFDLVLCAEVLEHLDRPEDAARELARVSKRYVLIGVPNQQDLGVGKWRCPSCRYINPPFGHLQTFDEQRVRSLLEPLGARVFKVELVGKRYESSNAISRALMALSDYASSRNYGRRCNECGKAPLHRKISSWKRTVANVGVRIEKRLSWERAAWVHALFKVPTGYEALNRD